MRNFPRLLLTAGALLMAVRVEALIGPAFQAQLGNPSGATADPAQRENYLLSRPQYVLGYNDANREANWVSWNLTTTDRGAVERTDDFAADPLLPAGFTAIDQNGYRNSGFDRGHLCPSADRTLTVTDNQATFYMTNIVPQTPDNNQGPWARFEDECRRLAALGNELLIVSGPGGFPGPYLASGVAIPGFTWKVVVVVPNGPGAAIDRINVATRVIALKVPNLAGIRSVPWQNFITSAAEIERETGFTFFTALPPSIATALRAKVDGQSAAGDTRLANLSTRTSVGPGAERPAIVGFVIGGSEPKPVLVRAAGPALREFGVTTGLAAPRLDLVRASDGATLASNVGWTTGGASAAIASAAARAGAFPFADGSGDSAAVTSLAPGNYSAVVTSHEASGGVVLVEVYDLSDASPSARLANVSTRSLTGSGDDTLIAGFVIAGSGGQRLLIRAAGPALTQFNVNGPLARPQLTLFGDGRAIAQNAGWSASPDANTIASEAARVGAFGFAPGSADAALVVALPPGAYSAQATSIDAANGIVLIEVYELR